MLALDACLFDTTCVSLPYEQLAMVFLQWMLPLASAHLHALLSHVISQNYLLRLPDVAVIVPRGSEVTALVWLHPRGVRLTRSAIQPWAVTTGTETHIFVLTLHPGCRQCGQ